MKVAVIIALLMVGVIIAGCIGGQETKVGGGYQPSQNQSLENRSVPDQTEIETAVNETNISDSTEIGDLTEEMPF